jgi:ElaB/YqjD/DUF883 family membrane-anchored ribosome-binding protein
MAADYSTTETSTSGRATEALRQSAREYLTKGKEKAMELEEGFEGMVQEHPIRSILIAAGVGALIGALICRR